MSFGKRSECPHAGAAMGFNSSHQSQGAELCLWSLRCLNGTWGGHRHSSTQRGRSAALGAPAFWHCTHRRVSRFLTRAAGNDKPCRQHDTLITATPRKKCASPRGCHQGSMYVPFQGSRHLPPGQGSPGTQSAPGKGGQSHPPAPGRQMGSLPPSAAQCARRHRFRARHPEFKRVLSKEGQNLSCDSLKKWLLRNNFGSNAWDLIKSFQNVYGT